jgi:hypothetical protein
MRNAKLKLELFQELDEEMENLRADGHRGMGIAGMDKVEIQPRRD